MAKKPTIGLQTEKALQKILPFKFQLKDVLQVMIGASILAIPVGLTEETWKLGETLPMTNIIGFMVLSMTFISVFVYYNYHHKKTAFHKGEFMKRVLSTYFVSFVVVALLLTLIQKTPWLTQFPLAFNRVVLVTFPASMSAAVADMIK